jgi:hypothetical protein
MLPAIFVHSKDPIQFYPSEEGYIVYLYNEVENVGFIVLNFGTEEWDVEDVGSLLTFSNITILYLLTMREVMVSNPLSRFAAPK